MTAWRPLAACRGLDPNMFHPPVLDQTGRVNRSHPAVAPALAVCAACPVAGRCMAWALAERLETGIYGGTLPAERRWLLSFAPLAPVGGDGACGSERGYGKHRRLGEATCDECRAAHARFVAERRAAVPA